MISYWCISISNVNGIFVHIIGTLFGLYLYEDRYKIKSRIFTCKYSRVSNWICIMYSICYLYICKLDHTIYITTRPNTSFQSSWNIDTIKILSSYNCYLAQMQVIKLIKTQPWHINYVNQNFRMHLCNAQGDTFWTSSSSTGGEKLWKCHVHKWPIG